jgi:hypothetical protein
MPVIVMRWSARRDYRVGRGIECGAGSTARACERGKRRATDAGAIV